MTMTLRPKLDRRLGPVFLLSQIFLCPLAWADKAQSPSSEGPSIRSSIGGTVIDRLPRPEDTMPMDAEYPPLGSIKVTVIPFGGDPTVAILSLADPNLEFVIGEKTLQFVLGYWVAPASAVEPLPTASTWVPLGTASASPSFGGFEQMLPIGKGASATPKDSSQLLAEAIQSLTTTAGYKMHNVPDAPRYNVYFAMTMCKKIRNASNLAGSYPQPYKIAQDFETVIMSQIDQALDTAGTPEAAEKFTLQASADSLSISIDPTGTSSTSSDAFSVLAKNLLALPYPAAASDLTAYGQAIAGSAVDQLVNLHKQIYAQTSCSKGLIPGVENTAKFEWEAFPLQLTCKAFSIGQSFDTLVRNFMVPTVLPNVSQFSDAQKALAKALFRAALIQQSQIQFSKTYGSNRAKGTCFQEGMPYINKMLGSMPINVMSPAMNNFSVMTHPEPLFTLAAGAYLKSGSGDKLTVYHQTGTRFEPMPLTQGTASPAPNLLTKSYLLQMHVRGLLPFLIGIPYCWQEGFKVDDPKI